MSNTNLAGIRLHRFLLNAPKHLQVDHIDTDTLNNQRYNLRLCSNQQNNFNRNAKKGKHLNLKGVFLTKSNKFRTVLGLNYKTILLGTFTTKETAAYMYNLAAKALYKEFAKLNKIENNQFIDYNEVNKALNKKGERLSIILNFSPFFVHIFFLRSCYLFVTMSPSCVIPSLSSIVRSGSMLLTNESNACIEEPIGTFMNMSYAPSGHPLLSASSLMIYEGNPSVKKPITASDSSITLATDGNGFLPIGRNKSRKSRPSVKSSLKRSRRLYHAVSFSLSSNPAKNKSATAIKANV